MPARHPDRSGGAVLVAAILFAVCGGQWATHTRPSPAALDRALSRRVNPNTADRAELQLLPQVGPATAEKIVRHRQGAARYTDADDLRAVPGIGPKTAAKVEPHLRFQKTPENDPASRR